jgi:hypothetical protein
MKKHFFWIISLFSLLLLIISGYKYTTENKISDCQTACERIWASEEVPLFDVSEGISMYYGNLDQKRAGTPSSWIHILEDTKSSQWLEDKSEKNSTRCDCMSQIEKSEFPQCEINYIKTGQCDESKCNFEARDVACSFDPNFNPRNILAICKKNYCNSKDN